MSDSDETSSLRSFTSSLLRGLSSSLFINTAERRNRLLTGIERKQVISGSSAVTVIQLSPDSQYLAVGNQEGVLKIYGITDDSSTLVFKPSPLRIFRGHQGAILDLAWSRNNFIATASADKTVRLWHVRHDNALCAFVHRNIVTCVKFHPTDDRYILTGCLDSRVRVWAAHQKKVVYWNELANNSYITAVSFTMNASMVIVGTYTGDLIFYLFEELKYHTLLSINPSASTKKQYKITAIDCIIPRSSDNEKLVVTCNDGKIRIYNLRDKSLYCVYRGGDFKGSQLRATMDEDGKYLFCGGINDKSISIWPLDSTRTGMVGNVISRIPLSSESGNRVASEKFLAIEDGNITSVVVAPRMFRENRIVVQDNAIFSPKLAPDLDKMFCFVADSLGRIHVYENSSASDAGHSRSTTATTNSSLNSSFAEKSAIPARLGQRKLKKSLSLQIDRRKGKPSTKRAATPPPVLRRRGSFSRTLDTPDSPVEPHFQPRRLPKEHVRVASEPLPTEHVRVASEPLPMSSTD